MADQKFEGANAGAVVQDGPSPDNSPRASEMQAVSGSPKGQPKTISQVNSDTDAVDQSGIDMLSDVELRVTAELGRTKMTIGEIKNLTGGSIVTLNKGAGEHADLRINDKLFASGEVIVKDGFFAVKITKLLSKEERMKNFS